MLETTIRPPLEVRQSASPRSTSVQAVVVRVLESVSGTWSGSLDL